MSEKLPLTSAKWAALTHAYGEASDIPDLLSELAEAETLGNETADEPMFTLWSSLCHQDNVYPASFAAVPHLVEIAAAKKDAVDRWSVLSLVGAIAGAENDPSRMMQPEIAAAYHSCLPVALRLLCEDFQIADLEDGSLQYWLGTFCAFRQKPATARLLFSFDSHIAAVNTRDSDLRIEEDVIRELGQ